MQSYKNLFDLCAGPKIWEYYSIQGYYKIDNVIPFIGHKDKKAELRLRLKLSNYVAWGEWKKTDTALPHPDLYTLAEITNIYDSGIMFLPTKPKS